MVYTAPMIQFAAGSSAGAVRDHNEDSYFAGPDIGLWLVADGVGGHSHGEVASAIVAQTIKNGVVAGDSLVDAITDSHQAVLKEMSTDSAHAGMGSTVVAVKLRDRQFELAWVGDSRAYLWDGQIRQISRDHNPVSEMLRAGALSEEEAERHPERHVLSQSLGVTPDMPLAPGQLRGQLEPGQQLILCSDGLTDELTDQRIARIMRHNPEPQAQVDALIKAAEDAGGHDNVTVVVVGEPPSEEDLPQLTGANTLNPAAAMSESGGIVSQDQVVWGLAALMVILGLWFIF